MDWKIITIIIALLWAIVFGAYECDKRMPGYRTDNEMAQRLFLQCLEKLPEGPQETKYNDWDEVVDACRYSALSLSNKCYKNCGE